jgi:hypothetical protein
MTTFAPDLSGTSMGMMGQPVPEGAKKVHQLGQEMLAMREYALGEDGRSRCDGTVLLHVSHSNLKKTFFHELRLDMHSSIEAVKRKLEFHTGTSAVTNQVRAPSNAAALRRASVRAVLRRPCGAMRGSFVNCPGVHAGGAPAEAQGPCV